MSRKTLTRDVAVIVLMLAVLLALPLVASSAALRDFVIYVIAYGLLALSLNVLTGYAGLVSFGHAAYFASGSYAFGLLMQGGWSLPAAFATAVASSALLALVVGAICVRLNEIYFAFLTLAFQMLLHSVILTWVSLTGGDQGLMGGIPRPVFLGIDISDPATFYVACCVLFTVCVLFLRIVTESTFGYTLRMIRDNERRAVFLGVDVFKVKLAAFVIAGTVASIGGIVMALFVSGAYPAFAFWTTSGEAIFMVMLGGTQVFAGPLVGAVVLQTLNRFLAIYTEHSELLLGVAILVAVLGLRRGIADFAYDLVAERRRRPPPTAASKALETEDHTDPDGETAPGGKGETRYEPAT